MYYNVLFIQICTSKQKETADCGCPAKTLTKMRLSYTSETIIQRRVEHKGSRFRGGGAEFAKFAIHLWLKLISQWTRVGWGDAERHKLVTYTEWQVSHSGRRSAHLSSVAAG